jgi:hypothetical protein
VTKVVVEGFIGDKSPFEQFQEVEFRATNDLPVPMIFGSDMMRRIDLTGGGIVVEYHKDSAAWDSDDNGDEGTKIVKVQDQVTRRRRKGRIRELFTNLERRNGYASPTPSLRTEPATRTASKELDSHHLQETEISVLPSCFARSG